VAKFAHAVVKNPDAVELTPLAFVVFPDAVEK
jgi:hypothetical protein